MLTAGPLEHTGLPFSTWCCRITGARGEVGASGGHAPATGGAGDGQPLERQRQSHRGADGEVLPENIQRRAAAGSGVALGAGGDVAKLSVAVAIFLGGVRAAR